MSCGQYTELFPQISSLTDILSADSYVTASVILSVLKVINTKFLKGTEDDTNLTVDIKESIKTDLNSHYSIEHIGEVMKVLFQTATFLDPLFESKYMDSEESTNIQEKLKQECSTITLFKDNTDDV